MTDNQTSRRSVLKSGVAMASIGVMGSLSGCSVPFMGGDSGNGGGSGNASRAKKAPEGSDFLLHVSVSAMLSDDVVRQRANEALQNQEGSSGPQDIDTALSQVESQTGFDPSKVQEMLVFGQSEGEQNGAIVWTGWDQSAVTSALEQQGLQKDSYGGKTVFAESASGGMGTQSWIGLLSDSAYAIGSQTGVKAAIDTWTGSKGSVGGNTKTAFTAAQGGYMQFGFDVPQPETPDGGSGGGQSGMGGMGALNGIQYGYGSITNASNGRKFKLNLETDSKNNAKVIEGFLKTGIQQYKQQLEQQAGQSGVNQEQLAELQSAVDKLSVGRNGTTVQITNEDGVTLALFGLAVAASFAFSIGMQSSMGGSGSGSSSGSSETGGSTSAPQVNFQVEYNQSSGDLAITHAGGDVVKAERLYVQGQGLSTGLWSQLGGQASTSVDGSAAVATGDSLVVSNVQSDYRLVVVWQNRSSGQTAVLTQDIGPDA